MIRLLACLLVAVPATAAPTTVTLVHVNDTHSHVDAFGPKDASLDGTVGGLWKAASVIATIRATEPNTLLVHGGDLFHGDLFFQMYAGIAELSVLQSLGLDAMAVGNHEFEWGPETLTYALSSVFPPFSTPVVSANLVYPDAATCAAHPGACELSAFVRPTLTKEVGGVKVGFFGMTTPYDMIMRPYPLAVPPEPAALLSTVHDTAAALRADGAELVVMVSHLGLALDRQLAGSADVDVIIGGHDHAATPEPEVLRRLDGGTTLLVEAGDYYRNVGKLRVEVDGTSVRLVDYALIPIDESVPRLPALAPTMEYLKAEMVAQYGDVFHTALAIAMEPFPKRWDPDHMKRDTATGNLVTDIYREQWDTDLALEAMGLQDGDLPPGAIVGADVFRLMPYGYDAETRLGFRLATFAITGSELLRGLELAVAGDRDLFLQLSGVRFEYDSCEPPFTRVDPRSVHVGGRRLRLEAVYSVTANEGLVQMLPMVGIAVEPLEPPGPPPLVYHALRDGIAARGVLYPEVQGRIRDRGWRGCR